MGRPRQIGKDTLYRMVEPSRQDAGFWHHRDGIVIKYVWGWIRAAYCTVERVMNTMEWNLICLVCVCVSWIVSVYRNSKRSGFGALSALFFCSFRLLLVSFVLLIFMMTPFLCSPRSPHIEICKIPRWLRYLMNITFVRSSKWCWALKINWQIGLYQRLPALMVANKIRTFQHTPQ